MTALFAALILQSQEYALRWKPAVGEETRFQTSFRLVKDSVPTDVESEQVRKVLKVERDGSYTLKSTSLGMVMRTQGTEMKSDNPNAVVLGFGPNGNLTKFLTGKSVGLASRIAGFNCFVAPLQPVKEGDSYTITRAGTENGLPSSETKYTLKSVVGGLATLAVSFRETSGQDKASAVGTWTVDGDSGAPRSLELALSGFKTGLGELVSYKLTKV